MENVSFPVVILALRSYTAAVSDDDDDDDDEMLSELCSVRRVTSTV